MTFLLKFLRLSEEVETLGKSRHKVAYRLLFQFWFITLNQNYKSRSIEYNFNWCWHHTLPYEKESLPYLQKSALNIRNNNEGPRLLENTARLQSPSVLLPASLFPPPFNSQTDPYIPLKKLFDIQCWRVILQFLL